MLRSLFTGISGLNVHQTMLDVTGNNIANVNTTGFKSASTRFEDTFSQLVKSGAAPRLGERGGMNPSQVGLGVKLQSITNNFTNGAAQMTGRNLDTMINGDGFFVLKKTNGTSVYTRNGSFGLDAQGQVTAADGSFVQGWTANDKGEVNASGQPGNLTLPLTQTMKATPSTQVLYGGNLPADKILADPSKPATNDNAFSLTQMMRVFDDKGNPHKVLAKFTRADATAPTNGSQWKVQLFDADAYNKLTPENREKKADEGGALIELDGTAGGDVAIADGVMTMKFDAQGQLTQASKDALKTLKFKVSDYVVDETVNPKTVAVDPNGAVSAGTVNLDFSATTGFGGVNNFAVDQLDGNSAGTLTGFSIEADGTMRGTFSNGDTKPIGKIAMAAFSNPLGLEKAGSSYFVESGNSGQPQIGEPGSGPRGSMTGGAIEMSNVDLAAEFTNLILAQRGFQANSRVITTSDEILQELVNMKR